MIRRPPRSPLFPYPPLFRSRSRHCRGRDSEAAAILMQIRSMTVAAQKTLRKQALAIFRAAIRAADPLEAVLRHFRVQRSEEHTSELQSQSNLVCRLLLEKKK